MDLFTANIDKDFKEAEAILGEWRKSLPYFIVKDAIETLYKTNGIRPKRTIYPDNKDVTRIYRDLPPDKVKIVILGQDPYFDGNANGYAFGCKEKISPSLRQIGHCFRRVYKTKTISSMDLEYLVYQGVMLLNTVLTVYDGKPNSMVGIGWEPFVKQTIELLNSKDSPIVWMLWGKSAQSFKSLLNNPKHLVLTHEHPAAAARNNRPWLCDHFIKSDQFFLNHNIEPITWY